MSLVTLFNSRKQLLANKPLVSYLSDIKTGKYKESVERLRLVKNLGSDKSVQTQKRMIPRMTVCGRFRYEKFKMEFVDYSQCLFFEIPYLRPHDMLEAKAILMRSPYVLSFYKNAIGDGLCFIAKSSRGVEFHDKMYKKAYTHFSNLLDTKRITLDTGIEKSSMLSYDPEIHLNLACIPFLRYGQIQKPSSH